MRTAGCLALLVAACASPRPRPSEPPPIPAELAVRFQDDMSASFRLLDARFSVDGTMVFRRGCPDEEPSCRADLRHLLVYRGVVAPGPHAIEAVLRYRHQSYGVFTYVPTVHFEIRSRHATATERGRRTEVRVQTYEQGTILTPLAERPAVRWSERAPSI